MFSSDNLLQPLAQGFENVVPKLPTLIGGFLIGVVIIRLLSWLAQGLLGLVRMPKGLRSVLVSVIDALLWIFLVITFLGSLGLGNLAIVLSGGIAAIGLALAASGSVLVSDVLAGIFLAKDRDFSIGDEVIAGDKGTQGIVEHMDMRRTRLRTTDGKLHVIPNSIVERNEWVVIKK